MGLLWTTVHHTESKVMPNYPQHIHRAPTDDSVKLLREMEAAARDNVLEAWQPESNVVRGTVVCERDPMTLKKRVTTLLKVNGRDFRIRMELDDDVCLAPLSRREKYRAIVEAATEAFTEALRPQLVQAIAETLPDAHS